MKVDVRIRIRGDEIILGKGVRMVLQAIDETGSISGASKKTGISYPKALRMIQTLNKEIGYEVAESEKGGSNRGGTKLTKEGKELLEKYALIEDEVQSFATKKVQEIMPEIF